MRLSDEVRAYSGRLRGILKPLDAFERQPEWPDVVNAIVTDAERGRWKDAKRRAVVAREAFKDRQAAA